MRNSEESTSAVKWSEGLSNRVSIIIRRYIVQMKAFWLHGCFFYNIFSYYFGSIFYYCIFGCLFCIFLFNFVAYVFLLLCMFRFGYSVSLCCSVCCLRVTVYCNTATGCQPNCSSQQYHNGKYYPFLLHQCQIENITSTVKIEAVCSSETSGQPATQCGVKIQNAKKICNNFQLCISPWMYNKIFKNITPIEFSGQICKRRFKTQISRDCLQWETSCSLQ